MSTEICTKLFTRRRIKLQDRRSSFSISLNFYQTILESSLQTRFMFDIKKLLNRCANIYSRRNTGRPVENCDRFVRIPSNSQSRSHYCLQQSRKYRCRVRPATLRYSTTQFLIVSLCCVSFMTRNQSIAAFFFSKGFSAKQQKKPKKKKSIERYRALRDKYTENKMFVSKNDQSK